MQQGILPYNILTYSISKWVVQVSLLSFNSKLDPYVNDYLSMPLTNNFYLSEKLS